MYVHVYSTFSSSSPVGLRNGGGKTRSVGGACFNNSSNLPSLSRLNKLQTDQLTYTAQGYVKGAGPPD